MKYVCPMCGYEGLREVAYGVTTETDLNINGKDDWEIIDTDTYSDEIEARYECPNTSCNHQYKSHNIYDAINEMTVIEEDNDGK